MGYVTLLGTYKWEYWKPGSGNIRLELIGPHAATGVPIDIMTLYLASRIDAYGPGSGTWTATGPWMAECLIYGNLILAHPIGFPGTVEYSGDVETGGETCDLLDASVSRPRIGDAALRIEGSYGRTANASVDDPGPGPGDCEEWPGGGGGGGGGGGSASDCYEIWIVWYYEDGTPTGEEYFTGLYYCPNAA